MNRRQFLKSLVIGLFPVPPISKFEPAEENQGGCLVPKEYSDEIIRRINEPPTGSYYVTKKFEVVIDG